MGISRFDANPFDPRQVKSPRVGAVGTARWLGVCTTLIRFPSMIIISISFQTGSPFRGGIKRPTRKKYNGREMSSHEGKGYEELR